MTNEDPGGGPPRVRLPEWISIAGFVLALAAQVWVGGGLNQQLRDNTRRIEALEHQDVGARLASIEAKLDIVMQEKGFVKP